MPGAVLMAGAGGAGSILDLQSMVVGTSGTTPNQTWGYLQSPAQGSMTDGTSNIYGGAQIVGLRGFESSGQITLVIAGNGLANSGWENVRIVGSDTFVRASASYSTNGTNTFWTWASGTFPTSGTVAVEFTA